ncbi:succinylglutamate desuccinylase/aspartoacylase family protein [Natronorubrum sp. A-ect3]|uniref:succinylglutamate desuccinylase/aspartoacylase domain-containing protein n=1 Tax=Natronorubrum sp. A-ect3 TaxID=3242698 RepID=UPI00359F0FA1
MLTAAVGCTLAGIAGADSSADSGTDLSRHSFQILEGTDHETTVYQTAAHADGPTVLVIGGVHGNEVAGYEAASQIAEWEIDAGTLITIPHADAEAVEQQTRTGSDGVDLNRQFPDGEEPTTDLARELWNLVAHYDPDVVIDLHESIGIYAGSPVDGVGQAIFHSGSTETAKEANQAADTVNRNHVDEPRLEFKTDSFARPENEPSGLLVHKATRDLDARSFLIETYSRGPDLETRIRWHTELVTSLIEEELFTTGTETDDSAEDTSDEPGEEPVIDQCRDDDMDDA